MDPSETTQVSRGPDQVDAAELLSAVRALSAQVGGLQAELQALRAQSLPVEGAEVPGWDDRAPGSRQSPAWVRSLDSPATRRPQVPRLLLEIAFLVAVALLAAVADFDPAAIAATMAGAWLLVALVEWTGARTAKLRDETLAGAMAAVGASFADDPSWYAPPVERTVLEAVESGEDTDPGTTLPPPPEE